MSGEIHILEKKKVISSSDLTTQSQQSTECGEFSEQKAEEKKLLFWFSNLSLNLSTQVQRAASRCGFRALQQCTFIVSP